MKTRTRSLEDEVRAYAARAAKSRDGAAIKRSFAEAVEQAITNRRRSGAGFGATAERLAEAGLERGGVGDYLEGRASGSLTAALGKAENARLAAEATRRMEKEKEEAALDEKLNAIKNKVLYYALAEGITDYDLLYTYATNAGLDDADARAAALSGAAATKESIRKKAIAKVQSTIISKRLTRNQAYEYAISLDLDEEAARELAELAYRMNESIGGERKPTGQAMGDERLHTRA